MTGTISKTIVCILSLQCCVCATLYAAPFDKVNSFAIGPSLLQRSYEEPGLMEDKGVMYGLSASYLWHGDALGPIGMMKVESEATWGSVDYSSSHSGTMKGVPDSMFETRVLLGTYFPREGSTVFTPYAGLGYRRLTDNSEGMISSSGGSGYSRQSNYYYSPIGIEISSNLEKGWSIAGSLEYDLLWHGTQVTSGSIYNDQKSGYGIRAAAKIRKQIDASFLSFEPFIRYWNIDASDMFVSGIYGVVEPKNNTTEYGVRIALEF